MQLNLRSLWATLTVQRFWVIAIPYIWLTIFFLVPFFLIFKISFAKPSLSLPPFTDIVSFLGQHVVHITLNFGNYWTLLRDSFYIKALASSIGIAGIATLACFILGYMMAYGLARAPKKWRLVLLTLVILPFFTSFLIRVYALMAFLSTQGVLNIMLIKLGFIHAPLPLLDNQYAVCLGIVYCYLPFMVLPIYAVLDKIDESLIEAAFDLGCSPWQAFYRVTVPLSWPGILSGCMLVFIPAIGEFVIPELLGGPDTLTIGRTLWWEFFNNRDWPLACAIATTIVVVLIVPIMWVQNHQFKKQESLLSEI